MRVCPVDGAGRERITRLLITSLYYMHIIILL